MSDAKEMKTFMHPTTHLGLHEESTKVDETQYRAMIDSLLYLARSGPNIMFSVCLCARFQKEPREVHLTVVKCIFGYLIGTPNLSLLFKRRESFKLMSYCEVDHAGDKVERKSTSGSCHLIEGNLVTWICKKYGSTTLFTTKAEYMLAASCCNQLLWIKDQLEGYNIYESKILIYCDNRANISLLKNQTLHSRVKHIEIKHHFIRDHIQNGTVNLQFVTTNDQLANIFTKPLTEERLILLRSQLGMISVND